MLIDILETFQHVLHGCNSMQKDICNKSAPK